MSIFKKLILVLILILSINDTFADQLSYITKSQADTAIRVLKNQSKVLLWCACCDNDPKVIMKVKDIQLNVVGQNNEYYQIVVIGRDNVGKEIKKEIDLAYTFILKNGQWYNLGQELKFKCDPCTRPFKN